MPIKLNGATSGSVELGVPDVVGSDASLTLPTTNNSTILAADPTKLSVDSSGRLLTPARPSFLARGTVGAINAPTTNTAGIISSLFTNVSTNDFGLHNIGGHYNTSSGVFTCPLIGLYFCQGHVRWETNSFTQNSYIRTYIQLYGPSHTAGNSLVLHQIQGSNESSTSYMDQNVAGVLYCQAGDTIHLAGGMDNNYAKLHATESSFGVTFLG
jgi:hypothetical protein